MKLCFIGNSHLVAVRQALTLAAKSDPGYEAICFAASGRRLKGLSVRGRSLVARRLPLRRQLELTSGGKRAIRIDAYDGFVLVGLRLGLVDLLRTGDEYRPLGSVGAGSHKYLVSEEAFELSVARVFEDTEFARTVRLIRAISPTAPIVASPTPLPNAAIAVETRKFWADTALLGARIDPIYREMVGRFAKQYDVAIAEQREATIENGYFTKPEFGEDTVRLVLVDRPEAPRPEDDQRHMNAAYGALVLEDVLARLPKGRGAR